jgi:hypothetical protein
MATTDYSGERRNPGRAACAAGALRLRFTGDHLVMSGGSKEHSYPAYSGNGARAAIPKGRYWINPSELWERTGLGDVKRGFVELLTGVDPAPYSAWGMYRITIHPYPGTKTGGRGGFFIHGGTSPGSLGCIDLVHNMDTFVADLRRELRGTPNCFVPLNVE